MLVRAYSEGIDGMGIDGMLNKSKIVTYVFSFLCHLFFMKSPVQDLKWVVVASKIQNQKINVSDSAINDLFILYKNIFYSLVC